MDFNLTSKLLYPNPFQPTGIEFELPEEACVTVEILDNSGLSVETLMEHKHCSTGKISIAKDLVNYLNDKHCYKISAEIGGKIFIETKLIR